MVRSISALPLVLLASVAIAATPFPLQRRQSSSSSDMSTEEYNCHLNCGELYLDSESGSTDYCTTGNYTTELSACLACADTYDIWQYYGTGVSSAASACGDTSVTPSAASSTTAAATASAAATGNSTVTSGSAASTTGASSGASASTVSVTTTSTTGSASATGSSSSSSASASVEVSTGGASSVVGEISLAAVIMGLAARLVL